MANERVLIVEDEAILAESIVLQLEQFDYRVVGAFETAEQALAELEALAPDIVLMDIMLPGEMDGIEAAQVILERYAIPVVYLTAYDDEKTLERAKITEPFGYILKPYLPRELHANIAMALYKAYSDKQLQKAACSTEVYDSISDALVGLDKQGLIKALNQTAETMFGIKRDKIIGQSWQELFRCKKTSDKSVLEQMISGAGSEQSVDKNLEFELLLNNTVSHIVVEVRCFVVKKRDAILVAVLVVRDVTERKKAEQELAHYQENLEELVQQRTQELFRINQELDTYNYSVSHDLRAPLRAIDGFSLALMEDYGERLDEQAHAYLGRVRNASQRMGELIDDLLLLSRISMNPVDNVAINLTDLVKKIEQSIKERDQKRQFKLTVDDSLAAIGDNRLVRILLENLIDNAVKFTAETASPLIEVGKKTVNQRTVYYVCDNGIGFDMNYSDKIFQVFQRLHGADKYEGTGVGLAIAQRIVHKHHGDIWAEGTAKEGACFYFTLEQSRSGQRVAGG